MDLYAKDIPFSFAYLIGKHIFNCKYLVIQVD